MKKLSTFFATLLVSVLLIGSTSFAQVTWTGNNSSNWSVGINWSGNSVPGAADDVIIPSGTPNSPLLSDAANTVNSLVINAGATLDLNGKNFASGVTTINGTLLSSVIAATPFLQTGDIIISGTLNATNIPDIRIKGDWTRTGTYTIGTVGTVSFTGTGAQTINSSTSFPGLTINGTGPVGLDTDILIAGDLTLTLGNFQPGAHTVTLSGSSATPMTSGGGTFVPGTSTVIYQGSNTAQTLYNGAGVNYNNLTINHAGVTFAAGAGMTVSGNLNITAGTFNAAGATVNVKGNFTNSGSFSSTGAGTMNFNGTTAQAIAGVAYSGLLINNTAGVTLSGTASATNLTIAGTFIDAGNQLTGSAAGTIVFTSGTFKLGAATATTFPVFLPGTMTFGAGTVEYASSAAQTVSSGVTSYNRLVLSGAGVKKAQGSFATTGFENTSTFDDNGKTVTVNGYWVGASGFYSTGAGTVDFAGAGAQTVDGSTFNNVLVSGTGSLAPTADLTINKNFTIAATGEFTAGAHNYNIAGNWSQLGGGIFTNTSSTITFTGTGSISTTTAFNNFVTTAAATVTPANGFTAVNFTNGGVFVAGAFGYTVTGNWASAGTFTKGTSTVTLSGTGKTVDGTSFNNLLISGSITPSANFASTGLATITGTLTLGGWAATGSGTLEVAPGATLSTTGVDGFNSSPATTGGIQTTGRIYDPGANFTYNGTSAQVSGTALGGLTVNNLTINNTAGVTLNGTGTTTVNGTLTLTSGALAKSNGNLDFIAGPAGTIDRSGGSLGFVPTGSTSINVIYSGSTAINPPGNELPVGGGRQLNNLIINNAGGVTLVSGSTSTVTGTLTFTSGILTSNGALTMDGTAGATVIGGGTSSFVNGKLIFVVTGGASRTLVYPIGTGTDYRPVTAVMDLGAGTQTYSAQMVNGTPPTKTLPGTLGKVSEVRYYTLTGPTSVDFATTPGITVTLNYGSNDGVSDAVNLRMAGASTSATAWTDLGGGGSAVPSGFITRGATTVGTFVLATNFGTNNVLPVELTSFYGESKEDNIVVNWGTATEINSLRFSVERSAEKDVWEEIGSVKAAGNSNAPKTYSYIDKNLTSGSTYSYRLKYVDVDGSIHEFGKVITVEVAVPVEYAISQNYPNPFNPSTVIKYALPEATHVTLKIYNMLGQEVATLVNTDVDKGFHSIVWNSRTSNGNYAASGVYIYRIVAGNFVQTKKMNLLK